MLRKLIKIVFILLIVVASISIVVNHYIDQDLSALQEAKVTQVYDGDTIQVSLNNNYETIRLIGVDTPEIKGKYNKKNEYYGKKSAKFLKELLPKGRTVYLEADIENTDQYNRLLRYIWLDQEKEIFVNLILLEKGYAETLFFEPNTKFYESFKNAEKKAKENNVGRWGKN